jgi:hypothetical protein
MPQILVVADHGASDRDIVFRERVTSLDFESDHSAHQLLQRLEWAVADAHEVERRHVRRLIDDAEVFYAPASVVTTAS